MCNLLDHHEPSRHHRLFRVINREMKMKQRILFGLLGALGLLFASAAQAATVVALGASNTYGKGVSRGQAYPAQLEALLRARGLNARVINAGINGDTTGGMLARLNSAVPRGTSVVILQPGGNDRRKMAPDQTSEIETRLATMGVNVILLPNAMLHGLPHQPDGQHLTPEGYHMLAEQLVGRWPVRSGIDRAAATNRVLARRRDVP
jgi:acyl-CoA thioesterase-1